MADRIIRSIQKNSTERLDIALTQFKGRALFAPRVWAQKPDGSWVPTQKGVTIQIGMLPAVREGLVEAERQAVEAGLLERSA